MWDEKEDNNMNDEMLEGSGHEWIMAHDFVLQNVELMSTWCMWPPLYSCWVYDNDSKYVDIVNYVKHKTLQKLIIWLTLIECNWDSSHVALFATFKVESWQWKLAKNTIEKYRHEIKRWMNSYLP
jgi:hypothetical protein